MKTNKIYKNMNIDQQMTLTKKKQKVNATSIIIGAKISVQKEKKNCEVLL